MIPENQPKSIHISAPAAEKMIRERKEGFDYRVELSTFT